MKVFSTCMVLFNTIISFGQFSNIIFTEEIKLDSSNFRVFYGFQLSEFEKKFVKNYLDSSQQIVEEEITVDTNYIASAIINRNKKSQEEIARKMGRGFNILNPKQEPVKEYSFQAIPIINQIHTKYLIIVVLKKHFEDWYNQIILLNDGGYAQQCYGVL